MTSRIEKKDLVDRVSQRTNHEAQVVEEIIDATIEEMYGAFTTGRRTCLCQVQA